MVNFAAVEFLTKDLFPWDATIQLVIENKIVVKGADPQDVISKNVLSDIKSLCTGTSVKNPVQEKVDFNAAEDIADYFFERSSFKVEKLDINSDVATVKTEVEILYANKRQVTDEILKKIISLNIKTFFGSFTAI